MKATLLPSAARQTTPPPTAAPARKAAAPEPTGLPPDALAAWQATSTDAWTASTSSPSRVWVASKNRSATAPWNCNANWSNAPCKPRPTPWPTTVRPASAPSPTKSTACPKTIQSYCGALCLHRTHGWCAHCDHWVFPADAALGLGPDSTASPLLQELCALLVTKT